MAEIQKHVIKRGKRNAISRHFRAKGDEEAVAAWKSGLERIRRVFEARPSTSVLKSLTFRPQTDFTVRNDNDPDIRCDNSNTGAIIPSIVDSDSHHDTARARPIPSNFRNDHTDTHTTALTINQNTLKNRKGANEQNRAVSILPRLPVARKSLTIA